MSEALYNFSPLSQFFRMKPKGQWAFRLPGSEDLNPGGDYTRIESETEVEEDEVYSNETPEPVLAMINYGQKNLTTTVEVRQLPHELLHVMMMSASGMTINQAAAADQEFTLVAMRAGRRRKLPHLDVNVSTVSALDGDDEAVAYVLGTHYRIHKATGQIEITAHPEGVVVDADGAADVLVEYDADAIVDKPKYGLMSQVSTRLGFNFVSSAKYGPRLQADIWDCEAKFENIVWGADGNELATATLTLRAFADPTKPAGEELGVVMPV